MIANLSEPIYQNSSNKEAFNFVICGTKNKSHTRRFINRIKRHRENGLYCFKSSSLAFITMHKKASKMSKFVNEKENDEDIELKSVANKRKTEVKQEKMLNNSSPVLCLENLSKISIPTLENLFALISLTLANSKIIALMSRMVSSTVTSGITMLQVVLGLLAREKRLIKN